MKTIAILASVSVLLFFGGCSDDPPSIRVKNERQNKANVQIKQSNGNTINHNDVQPGAYSSYQNIIAGVVTVKAEMQNEPDLAEKSFVATDNHNYTIVILAGLTPSIRIDEQSK